MSTTKSELDSERRLQRGTDAYEEALELKIMNEGVQAEIVDVLVEDMWETSIVYAKKSYTHKPKGRPKFDKSDRLYSSLGEARSKSKIKNIRDASSSYTADTVRSVTYMPKFYLEVRLPDIDNQWVSMTPRSNEKFLCELSTVARNNSLDSITEISEDNTINVFYTLAEESEDVEITLDTANGEETTVVSRVSYPGEVSSDFDEIDEYIYAYADRESKFTGYIKEAYFKDKTVKLVTHVPGGESIFIFDNIDARDSPFWDFLDDGGNGNLEDIEGAKVRFSFSRAVLKDKTGRRKVKSVNYPTDDDILSENEQWILHVNEAESYYEESEIEYIPSYRDSTQDTESYESKNGLIGRLKDVFR